MNNVAPYSLVTLAELHQVRLIRFSVDPDEVQEQLPAGLRAHSVNGRAQLSFLHVEFRRKQPLWLPQAGGKSERYAAFQLMVTNSANTNAGVHVLHTFTDKRLIQLTVTDWIDRKPRAAKFQALDTMLELRAGEHYLNYALDFGKMATNATTPLNAIGKAYTLCRRLVSGNLFQPDQWPLRQVDSYLFETNFFSSAALIGAFVVDAPLRYEWPLIQTTTRCAS